jgi:hypothetical protein
MKTLKIFEEGAHVSIQLKTRRWYIYPKVAKKIINYGTRRRNLTAGDCGVIIKRKAMNVYQQ